MKLVGAVERRRIKDPLKAPRDLLREMGYESYADYLQSEHWQEVKARYRASETLPQRCAICNAKWVQLHHRTYRRLGKEKNSDLVALCRFHHHDLHLTYGWDDETLLLGSCTSQYIAIHAADAAKARLVRLEAKRVRREEHRERVRRVACAKCGAVVGQPCLAKKGEPRIANHLAREQEYKRLSSLAA